MITTRQAMILIGAAFILAVISVKCKKTTETATTVAPKLSQGNTMSKDIETTSVETTPVETTASGLKYQTLTAPADTNAPRPNRGQMVHVHYTGWLADKSGEPNMSAKFDSSVDRGQQFSFPVGVGMVIAGWEEGIMKMQVGEKCRLTIPAKLGYGAQGAGNVIPPNADLVFDVELFKVGN